MRQWVILLGAPGKGIWMQAGGNIAGLDPLRSGRPKACKRTLFMQLTERVKRKKVTF
jgi:hypothetical protein